MLEATKRALMNVGFCRPYVLFRRCFVVLGHHHYVFACDEYRGPLFHSNHSQDSSQKRVKISCLIPFFINFEILSHRIINKSFKQWCLVREPKLLIVGNKNAFMHACMLQFKVETNVVCLLFSAYYCLIFYPTSFLFQRHLNHSSDTELCPLCHPVLSSSPAGQNFR